MMRNIAFLSSLFIIFCQHGIFAVVGELDECSNSPCSTGEVCESGECKRIFGFFCDDPNLVPSECASGLECVSSRPDACLADVFTRCCLKAAGESCNNDNQCASNSCPLNRRRTLRGLLYGGDATIGFCDDVST